MVNHMLGCKMIDINLATEATGTFLSRPVAFTPLTAACIAGNYEIMQLLLDNGANVGCRNAAGNVPLPSPVYIDQTPLAYCFARLDEDTNMFENKNLCLKMAELLLQYGADINTFVSVGEGLTLLMQFCGMSMELSPFQTEVNLEVVQFLLEHGADRNRKSKRDETAWDLAKRHKQKDAIRRLLGEVKQKYFHPNEKTIPTKQVLSEYNGPLNGEHADLIIEDTGVKCGCFSCYR